jgi:RimJ/RimL family protein N-acetyltransferase
MDIKSLLTPENSQVGLFILKPEHVTQEYISWLNNTDVNRYLECRFIKQTMDATRNYVTSAFDSPNILFLGINSYLLNRHVGNIKIGLIDRNHGTGEVGIMVGDCDAWGKGIASMAIDMLSDIALKQLSLRKLTAGCYASNIGSLKAFKKAGYIIEGVRKQQFIMDGEPEDIVLMGRFLK